MSEQQPSRAQLLRVLEQQALEIARLRQLIGELTGRIGQLETDLAEREPSPTQPPPWIKPNKPERTGAKRARKQRTQGASRKRAATPTRVIRHAVAACPACECALCGGTLKRHREIIEIDLPPVRVTDHQLLERVCPQCQRTCVPTLTEADGVVGQHRFGANLLALFATWHEDARLPVDVIQQQLATLFRLDISCGAIVAALHAVAVRGVTEVEAIHQEIRQSPVVHSDETSRQEDGETFSSWLIATKTARYFEVGRRTNATIDTILGPAFRGTLVADFYAAYDHFPGQKQRCWAHLLRDARDLLAQYPTDRPLTGWVQNLRRLFRVARDSPARTPTARLAASNRLEAASRRLCDPFVGKPVPQRLLCQRILKYLPELITCVREPDVPPTNNEAERAFRPLVTGREIPGGTRPAQGTRHAMARATLFRTWHARDLNTFTQVRALLLSPQL